MILRLSVLAVFLALLWSCRGEDFAKAETNPQRNNSDFFKRQSSLYAKNGTDYIRILEEYNKETDFLSKMPDQKGMPIWDKMYVVETENESGLMIPLSYDSETMSSVLFATLDGKNTITGVRDYDNAILQDIVYNQKISVENRERLFLSFMHMDNRTFGNEQFIGIPKDLFIGKKSDDEYGVLWVRDFAPSSSVITQEAGKLMIIETCFIALHCTHHGVGLCDAEQGCTECGTTFCTYEVIGTADNPFPSTGGGGVSTGGGGGGGGGNAPGPNVPSNPCGVGNTSSAFYRPMPGCGGGGTLPEIDDPCKKTKKLINNVKTKPAIDALKTKSTEGGENGYKIKADGTPSDVILGGDHSVNFKDKTGYVGGYHNHTPTGISMLSPPDIDQLLGFARAQSTSSNLTNVNNAFIGMVAPNGMHYVIWFNGTYQDAVKTFSQEDLDKYVIDYRELEKDLTDETKNGMMYMNSDGSINHLGVEKLFFETLKNMGLDGKVNLQRIEGSAVKSINLDSDNKPTPTSC
ncbi:hypothetical protein [Chryseobacterium lactis]|uniref:hypothetical protein n=1 Tax=Chryseobacterium lactis TaxID=1241981 RepID=UPI00162490A4|nr:hypothetical protein [Chryseobacterium lactis]